MEQLILTEAQANSFGQNTFPEIVGLVINHTPGGFLAEIYIHDGIESLLSVYGITGQLRFRKKILSMELLDKQDEKERETSKKGAWYYRFNIEKYRELARNGFFFNLAVS